MEMLDPFVELLLDCIKSKSIVTNTLALKVLGLLFLVHSLSRPHARSVLPLL